MDQQRIVKVALRWTAPRRRGVLGPISAGYVPLASQSPYPIIVFSVANYRFRLSHFWGNMLFSRSQLSHFLFMYCLILRKEQFSFHQQYKHSGTVANRKYEELSCHKIQKMCDPILVTLLKMRPHPAAHPHQPLLRKYRPPPPPAWGANPVDRRSLGGELEN